MERKKIMFPHNRFLLGILHNYSIFLELVEYPFIFDEKGQKHALALFFYKPYTGAT
jgi:hypothetical protein